MNTRVTKELSIDKKYLHLPIRTGAPKILIGLFLDGRQVREFDAEVDISNPDFIAAANVSDLVGKSVSISLEPREDPVGSIDLAIDSISQSDKLPDNGPLYRESLRPQFHFSSKIGWNNDPNGLMYYDGEYHLFYQHNPFGWNHGNMHWGHAVSRDLIHWKELDEVLYPDPMGTMFSGSGVVDQSNTSGLARGNEKILFCIYTSAGGRYPWQEGRDFTQSLAFSVDRGRTWQKYAENPVLRHIEGQNRDPKVVWHEPTKSWVMVLFLKDNDYAIFVSPNLLSWEKTDDLTIPGTSECPDLFELFVENDNSRPLWVFWGARGYYVLGSFDGRKFRIESGPHRFSYGSAYAAQSFSDVPKSDGRRIQIAWLRGNKPGMPFNQQMSFPCELNLRDTPEGVRLHAEPVREIDLLHKKRIELGPGAKSPVDIGELLDVSVGIELTESNDSGKATVVVPGASIVYDRELNTLRVEEESAPLPPIGATLALRILIDRSSVEVIAQDGVVTIAVPTVPNANDKGIRWKTEGSVKIVNPIEIFELESIWK